MKSILKITAHLGLLLICVLGCKQTPVETDYIITERNLVPEGVAHDERTGTTYVSSTFKRKIVQITSDGVISDFIPEKYEGIESTVGMEVDEERGMLWATVCHAHAVMPLMDPDTTQDWMTSVWSFDIENRKMIRKYVLKADTAFLNDLTVLENGDVYVTESLNGIIYKIPAGSDSLELFLQPAGYTFLNGITFSNKLNAMYVAATEGIIRVDMSTKAFQQVQVADSIESGGIDGLAYDDGKLIGHQSTQVTVFHLDATGEKIMKSEVLDSGDEFESSTTGEIGDGYYYFIVNSQIRSGIDHERHTIKSPDLLKDVIIRKFLIN